MYRAMVYVEAFGQELKQAFPIVGGMSHEIMDVEAVIPEQIEEDDEVRMRVGIRGNDGSVQWFVSECTIFDDSLSLLEAAERLAENIPGLSLGDAVARLRNEELFDDE